jgi:hypothetical protein
MGRGISVRALLLSACVVWISGSIGCQPLYGGKPEKLSNPARKKKPEDAPEKPPEIKYVEDCTANFREEPPKVIRRDTPRATAMVSDGDTAIAQSPKAKDPASQAELIKQAIDKYRGALIKDPYHAEATLRLAIAYDMVYRKQCALLLLKRIAALETHPTYKPSAKRMADEVADNAQLFRGYRKDAVQAVGR